MKPTDQELVRLQELAEYRNNLQVEVNHRKLSGRAYKFKEGSLEELEETIEWIRKETDKILAPYEV